MARGAGVNRGLRSDPVGRPYDAKSYGKVLRHMFQSPIRTLNDQRNALL